MQKITYLKTEFDSPDKIDKDQYTMLKVMINKNPYFIIGDESVFPSIKNHILWAVISFIIMLIGFGLGEGITTVIGGFAMMSFITSIIFIILEVPSKMKSFRQMRKFYDRMKSKIEKSTNYNDFYISFYKN